MVLFGVDNKNLSLLQKKFPKLKIIGRGDSLKIFGEKEEIDSFEHRLKQITAYYERHNQLTSRELQHLIEEKPTEEDTQTKNKEDIILYGNSGLRIKARTKNQQKIVDFTEKNDMVFAIGPAGTGKTYTAVAMAVRALKNKEVKRIILTRPAVEAGENLGFLPGDMKEKLDPYLQPLYDALSDMIQHDKLQDYMTTGVIQIAPLAFMRGRTLDRAFVILDEAQNASFGQLKMFLTRMGKSAKFLITGDVTQIDLPKKNQSGLLPIIEKLKHVNGIGTVFLNKSDVTRHPLVEKIIEQLDETET